MRSGLLSIRCPRPRKPVTLSPLLLQVDVELDTLSPEHVLLQGLRTHLISWASKTFHNMGFGHIPQNGTRTRPTTGALNTSNTISPEDLLQHRSRTRPTTWASTTSHNMGPEHVLQHGSRRRVPTWAPNTFDTINLALVPQYERRVSSQI